MKENLIIDALFKDAFKILITNLSFSMTLIYDTITKVIFL
jgi:hypothetical protein